MEEQLNRGIKEVIAEYPVVGEILERFEIGCTTCTVGTCLFKDVVKIHFLTPEQEEALMAEVKKAIAGNGSPAAAAEETASGHREKNAVKRELNYSPPLKMLVDEHLLIKDWLALIPWVVKKLGRGELEPGLVEEGIEFMRNFADRYHHAKEEEILFKYADENAELIRVMYEDHNTGRRHVKAAGEALKDNNADAVADHLLAYRELLAEHIQKEDEILYPWIDRQLNLHQVGEIYDSFLKANRREGSDVEPKYKSFIEKLKVKQLKEVI